MRKHESGGIEEASMNQAAGESTALDPDAASVVGADGAPDSTIKFYYFGAVVLLVEMLWIKFVHLEELLMS
uniref:Uncharacterized protein n=1 Tax=Oryza barthii TaxID=65489 RepID=A0A0D3HK35_9ORYZ